MNSIITLLDRLGLNPRGEWPEGVEVRHVSENSRECGPLSLFVAVRGHKADGALYLPDAAGRGCRVALVEDLSGRPAPAGMTVIQVDDARRASGPVAQLVYGDPTLTMDVAGVTGTNGKTTTAFMCEAIYKAAGRRPGLIGTVITRWAEKALPSGETTPSGPKIAALMADMRRDLCDSVFFEVSSHAIDQRRVDGIRFRAMALTNVTQDHLDYHKTMDEYRAVKMAIFDRMREVNEKAVGVLNVDDTTGRALERRLPKKNQLTFAIDERPADLVAEAVVMDHQGIAFDMVYKDRKQAVRIPVFGRFNIYNALTAAGLCLAMGFELQAIAEGLKNFRGAPGRFQVLPGPDGVRVIVDYAHTPDAVIKLLQNARGLVRHKLIAVFGCGGDRDRGKRPLMGHAAAQLADEAIITNDNPRTEDPEAIAAEIIKGVEAAATGRPFRKILDRRAAIYAAIQGARPGDVVVIAGKGHEDYQIMGTEKTHFDDTEVALAAVRDLEQYRETAEREAPRR